MGQRFVIGRDGADIARLLGQAADVLRADGVALLPAEGLYGLHALAGSESARRRIARLKGERGGKAYILITGEPAEAEGLAVVSESARELIRSAWPGPLTLVLPALDSVPADWKLGDTIALRCPGDAFLRQLAQIVGEPLISTSANRSGARPPARVGDVDPEILAACDLVVDGGELAGVGSSVVRVESDGALVLLRVGLWEPGHWKGRMKPPPSLSPG